MDLKELRYFRAIAEFGTFSKAAAHLRVAQPALSRRIQKLEHSLGVELLRRTSRGVTPTEAGQILLERTLHLEQEIDVTRRLVAGVAEEVTGALRVAVQQPISILMIPDLIRNYRAKFPNVLLHIIDGYSGDILESLLDERLDIAILEKPSHSHADLTERPLWFETLRLVGPPSEIASPLFQSPPASFADMAHLPFIVPSQAHTIRRNIDAAFARQRVKFRPIVEADGAAMILAMVKAGLGYTLLPNCGIHGMARRGDIAVVDVKPAIRRTTSIVTRTALLNDRTVAPFTALVMAAAPELINSAFYGQANLYADGEPGAQPPGAPRPQLRLVRPA